MIPRKEAWVAQWQKEREDRQKASIQVLEPPIKWTEDDLEFLKAFKIQP